MRALALCAGACALAATGAGCGSSPARLGLAPGPSAAASRFAGTPIPRGAPAADFALRDQNGRLVRLSAQRGHLVFVAFLYTHCQDVCPLIAWWLDAAVRGLGARAGDVRILAVSVDPIGDTPAAVRAFVRSHRLGAQFHWLIGSRAQLAPVWQNYNVLVEPRTPGRIGHAAPVFLLDAAGRPRVFYPPPQKRQAFAHDLRLLLRR